MGFSRQEYWSGVPLPSPKRLAKNWRMYQLEQSQCYQRYLGKQWFWRLSSSASGYLNVKSSVLFKNMLRFLDLYHWGRFKSCNFPQLSSVQSLSCVQLFATLRSAARQASLSITNSQSSLNLMSIESVMPSNHLILWHPLLLPPSIFASIRVFSNRSVPRIRWPKYWNFSFSISPTNEHPGLVSFRMDWLDLLAVKGTLKSLLQHHSSKASILRHSAFFIVQLSHPYITTGKTIALTGQTFVGKAMSLFLKMLSRLVITFPPRSKRLLISWLQSPSAGILEPPKIKSVTISIVSPSICHEVMGPDAMIFVFWMLSFKPTFSLSSFTFIKRLFSSSLSAIRVVSSAYLRLLTFLPAVLIPTCASSSPTISHEVLCL